MGKYILHQKSFTSVLIFCSSKQSVKQLTRDLKRTNLPVDEIHSDLEQDKREEVLMHFKSGRIQILVATDLAARGIDVEGLSYVVHYQLPDQVEYYTHRSGRTARAGKNGLSLSLVTKDEMKNMRFIEKNLGISILEAK